MRRVLAPGPLPFYLPAGQRTPAAAPGPVAGLALTPLDAAIGVTWAASSDAVDYLMRWRPVGAGSWTTLAVPGPPQTITGLANGTPYEVGVAGRAGGVSGPQSTASTTPLAGGPGTGWPPPTPLGWPAKGYPFGMFTRSVGSGQGSIADLGGYVVEMYLGPDFAGNPDPAPATLAGGMFASKADHKAGRIRPSVLAYLDDLDKWFSTRPGKCALMRLRVGTFAPQWMIDDAGGILAGWTQDGTHPQGKWWTQAWLDYYILALEAMVAAGWDDLPWLKAITISMASTGVYAEPMLRGYTQGSPNMALFYNSFTGTTAQKIDAANAANEQAHRNACSAHAATLKKTASAMSYNSMQYINSNGNGSGSAPKALDIAAFQLDQLGHFAIVENNSLMANPATHPKSARPGDYTAIYDQFRRWHLDPIRKAEVHYQTLNAAKTLARWNDPDPERRITAQWMVDYAVYLGAGSLELPNRPRTDLPTGFGPDTAQIVKNNLDLHRNVYEPGGALWVP